MTDPNDPIFELARSIVELNKIQRSQGDYVIDRETQSELDRTNGNRIYLNDLNFSQGPDGVSFQANLTDKAVTQVFALDNPSRLVVDLFDTILAAKADVWPINSPQSSVQRVRLGQFQLSNPCPITRMVFDLKEPGVYALDAGKEELIISFFKALSTSSVRVISEYSLEEQSCHDRRGWMRPGRYIM